MKRLNWLLWVIVWVCLVSASESQAQFRDWFDRTRENVSRHVEDVRDSAREQRERMERAARERADQTRQAAQRERERLEREIQERAAQIQRAAQQERERLERIARERAEQARQSAQRESERIQRERERLERENRERAERASQAMQRGSERLLDASRGAADSMSRLRDSASPVVANVARAWSDAEERQHQMERIKRITQGASITAVRHIPVWDEHSGRITTMDTMMRNLVNELGGDDVIGSDLAADPVRTGFLMLTDADVLHELKIIQDPNSGQWISMNEAKNMHGVVGDQARQAYSAVSAMKTAYRDGDPESFNRQFDAFQSSIERVASTQITGTAGESLARAASEAPTLRPSPTPTPVVPTPAPIDAIAMVAAQPARVADGAESPPRAAAVESIPASSLPPEAEPTAAPSSSARTGGMSASRSEGISYNRVVVVMPSPTPPILLAFNYAPAAIVEAAVPSAIEAPLPASKTLSALHGILLITLIVLCGLTLWLYLLSVRPTYRLRLVFEDGTTRVVHLRKRDAVIGRAPGCDVVLNDPFTSSRHASLRFSEKGVHIRDLGSANGVLVGDALCAESMVPFKGSFRVGKTQFQVLTG